MAATIRALIKADLLEQLNHQKKTGKHFVDLVDDYIFLYDTKKKMQKDIKKSGLRYKTVNGNGIEIDKPNENVQSILKVSAQMLKILSELGLQEPSINNGGDDSDYL